MSPDEQILLLLADGPQSAQYLAESMEWHGRSVRRRLRRLVRDGYVFSPSRGLYRLTARGRAAMADEAPIDEREESPEDREEWPRHPLQRWIGGSSSR